jgi:hypothetical protein
MNSNTVDRITKIGLVSTGGFNTYGVLGQQIISTGSSSNAIWVNPHQTPPLANYGGGGTIDDTTPYYIEVSTSQPSFPQSPASRYKVDISAIVEGVNDTLYCFTRVRYNTTEYYGEIFTNPLLPGDPYVSEPATKSGVTHHSIAFTDYVTFPYTYNSNILTEIGIGIYSEASGPFTTNDARISATITPCFD